MSFQNTLTSYGSVAKFFHWIIALLVLFMLVFGYSLGYFSDDVKPSLYNIHKLTGITILLLMILRGIWALFNPKPILTGYVPHWQKLAERMVHFMLYLFVILMPLFGWMGSVAAGRAPHIGSFKFELPIQQNKALASAAFNMHGLIAIILIVLIVIHASAALYHHFIKRDNVLMRMLPH